MGNTKYIVTLLLCTIYGGSCNSFARVDPLVETNVGLIRGLTAEDGTYAMFLGIPYATVNSSNPFGASIPHEGFVEIFNAYDDSSMCPQRDEYNFTLIGSLDCLRLNVYAPRTASSRNRLPVMVYIHGGSYILGFGGRFQYNPKYLMRQDIIVVTLNYRLGAYGWLCLETPEVPGNQGLKDQLIALRWIKNNIEAFGGDSDKITIVGESAGGVSVDHHYLFSQENLFNKVIMQSGNALPHFANVEPDPGAALRLAAYLGHVTDNVNDALEFLATVNPDLIVAASEEVDVTFRPCVEPELENVERYVTAHPSVVTLTRERMKPVMIGFTSNELGFIFDDRDSVGDPFEFLEELRSDIVSAANLLETVRKFYIGDDNFDILNYEVQEKIGNFRSDFAFVHPAYRNIQKYLDNGVRPIYHYMFSYAGGRNVYKLKYNMSVNGALHTDELGYLFDSYLFEDTPSPKDQLIIDRITTLWANFVKFSDPTPEITDILPIRWPAVTSEEMNCFNIDSELSVQKTVYHERMAFWDLFYKLYALLLESDQNRK